MKEHNVESASANDGALDELFGFEPIELKGAESEAGESESCGTLITSCGTLITSCGTL